MSLFNFASIYEFCTFWLLKGLFLSSSCAKYYSLNGLLLQASEYLIGLGSVYWIKQKFILNFSRSHIRQGDFEL